MTKISYQLEIPQLEDKHALIIILVAIVQVICSW